MRKLTHKRLIQVLSYSKRTGIFRWKISTSNRAKAGEIAGTITPTGYVRIRIDDELWYGHRLAWFYVTGSPPTRIVDHKDNTTRNNRWSNLRLATASQNNANCGPRARNKTGFKGVSYSQSNKGYVAYIGKQYLGTYPNPEAAHAAYKFGAKKIFGKFARAA